MSQGEAELTGALAADRCSTVSQLVCDLLRAAVDAGERPRSRRGRSPNMPAPRKKTDMHNSIEPRHSATAASTSLEAAWSTGDAGAAERLDMTKRESLVQVRRS
jgi:hypothetical protein